jgi:hypothetical protein
MLRDCRFNRERISRHLGRNRIDAGSDCGERAERYLMEFHADLL